MTTPPTPQRESSLGSGSSQNSVQAFISLPSLIDVITATAPAGPFQKDVNGVTQPDWAFLLGRDIQAAPHSGPFTCNKPVWFQAEGKKNQLWCLCLPGLSPAVPKGCDFLFAQR